MQVRRIAVSLIVLAGVVAVPAAAQSAQSAPPNNDYCQGQCNDILPPGENGNATALDIAANKLPGTRPQHTDDQLGKYDKLLYDYGGLTDQTISQFYNDSSFGVPADQVASTVKPRSDVTIVRDKATGVPHIYGTTRSGTEFGAGYAAGNDRLWLMDVLRHVGRGELTSFAGGAAANRALEQSQWRIAPYTEQELQQQIDRVATSGPDGKQALADVNDYVAGINAYIAKAKAGLDFPGEYDLTGNSDLLGNGIQPFTSTDVVAIASLIGGIFGSGGGMELQSALVKEVAEERYGVPAGDKVWAAFRAQNDPEATLTLHDGQKFPYGQTPADTSGVAMPDPGSVRTQPVVFDPTGSASSNAKTGQGVLPGDLLSKRRGMSNALVVSGKYTDSGHPIAVFGPQTGYYAPQLLMLEELQGPGISARGAAFAGISMYVELGRGQDYSWSATSAEQDITDTYAVSLCNPTGGTVSADATYYEYHGQCLSMQALERDNSWKPTLADSTAAGSYKLITYRTKYGLVQAHGTVAGKPVAFTSLRSTYMHEPDSIIGFERLNNPDDIHSAADFQQAASKIGYAFNWFYVDSRDTAYYNSGLNPVRAAHQDPNLPTLAEPADEWQGFNPDTYSADYTAFGQHPNSIDQDYYISWNNKQAADYSAADGNFSFGAVHRGKLLDDRVNALVHGSTKVTRATLTQAMESAANVDLRAEDVLPYLLKVIDSQPVTDPATKAIVTELQQWLNTGAQRRPAAAGGQQDKDAGTIQVMDAWWPLLVGAEFKPGMGDDLFNATVAALQINESPSGGQQNSGPANISQAQGHKGSSFQNGWWGYVSKDIRQVLGDAVAGPLPKTYCGGGDLAQCRQVLLASLGQAAAEPATQVYPGDANCSAGDQWCADSIIQSPLGGITDATTNWQNRPTFQQVVQYPAHR